MSSIGISLNTTGCLSPISTLTDDAITGLHDSLSEIRDQMAVTDLNAMASGEIFEHQRPLDAAFYSMPTRLLSEFEADGDTSEIGRILSVAKRIQASFDAVVVLGIGGSYMGARALLQGLRSPYYNELDAEKRNGCPKIYFAGNNLDNGALSDLLCHLDSFGDRWCTIVISKSGGTLETAAALRVIVERMRDSAAGIGGRVIPITGGSGKLQELADQLGCDVRFPVPDGVGGRFSVFSAVGLLPAAVIGLDILELLRGASEANQCFEETAVAENPVLRFVAVESLMEQLLGCTIRVTSVWSDSLESMGFWYDQLLAESLGKRELGATPLTAVNTRDLHSRSQQHQQGRRDKLVVNLTIGQPGGDAIVIPECENDQDQLNQVAGTTYPELLRAAIDGTNRALNDVNRPTIDLNMQQLDERHMGQLLQFLMIATVAEGKLLGINPYGQPGVEAYKQNMKSILDMDS